MMNPAPTAPVQNNPSPAPLPGAPKPKKNKMLLIGAALVVLVIIIAVAAILLLGKSSNKNKASSTKNATSSTGTNVSSKPVLYTDSSGYQIDFPGGWTKITPPSGVSVEYKAPVADAYSSSYSYHPIIEILTGPTNGDAVSQISSQLNQSMSQSGSGYTNVNILKTTPETVAGQSAILENFTATIGGLPLTADNLVVAKGSEGYVIEGYALTSTWSKHSSDIEKSLLSFVP
jgi:hypothetical protein